MTRIWLAAVFASAAWTQSPSFVGIPAGSFVMGCEPAEPCAHTLPRKRVAFERPFQMMKTEVQVAGRQLVIHRPKNADDLIFEEEFTRDERLPYWAEVWPCGLA